MSQVPERSTPRSPLPGAEVGRLSAGALFASNPLDPSARGQGGLLEQMPTGIEGLDHLLLGGIVRGNSMLVEGPPGSGKTTLAVRILYEGIVKYDEPGLIITFEEFPRQLYLQAQAFGVDLAALEQAGKLRVIWTSPTRIIEGFSGRSDLIERVIEELGVKRVLIDSITHFKRVASSEGDLREVLSDVLSNLKIRGVNALFTKELEHTADDAIAFEEYLVDASLRLTNSPSARGLSHVRRIEVRKTRGQAHISGHHAFALTDEGPAVYPRLRATDIDRLFQGVETAPKGRVSTGISGLDAMLAGGLWNGSLNIVDGGTGTGKSVVASHFLEAGLARGEACLLISMRQSVEDVLAQARSLGMEWGAHAESGRLKVAHYHPTDVCVGKMVDDLVRLIRADRPARLVFDSIDDLRAAVKDEGAVRDYVLLFSRLFQAGGTTSVMIHHRGDGAEVTDYTPLVHCAIRLEMDRAGGQLRRRASIWKHANSDHSKAILPYEIDTAGFHLHVESAPLAAEPR